MDEAQVDALIEMTLKQAFGQGAEIIDRTEIPVAGTKRHVHKLAVTTPGGEQLRLFAKTGTDFQVRVEAALYQDVLGSEFTAAPRFIAATERDGVHCFITEEAAGEPLDGTNQDHVVAAFRALAQFHRQGRPHVGALMDIFTGPTSNVPHSADPQKMFDRIFKIWGLATNFGITKDDLAVFYDQRALDLVLNEEPTLVHGDFGLNNLLIEPATLNVRFIDFGFADVRAASSDFMYEFDSGDTFGDHLETGLRAYWESSDQGVSYETFRVRQAYWHASYYADVFSWHLQKEDLEDENRRSGRVGALECIRNGARYIGAHIAG